MKTQVHLRLNNSLLNQIDKLARWNGISRTAMISLLLTKEIETQKKENAKLTGISADDITREE
jgi:hypothetical protein